MDVAGAGSMVADAGLLGAVCDGNGRLLDECAISMWFLVDAIVDGRNDLQQSKSEDHGFHDLQWREHHRQGQEGLLRYALWMIDFCSVCFVGSDCVF